MSIYEIDESAAFSSCNLLRFAEPDETWLDFVFTHRTGMYTDKPYELIYGPVAVADDYVYETFMLYAANKLTKEETLKRLKIKRLEIRAIFNFNRTYT